MSSPLEFSLNGSACRVDVPAHWTVIDLLRDRLDLLGTKGGCGEGVCGTCTVLVDGEPARACLMLAAHLRGRALVTVEGLERGGRLDALQDAFARHGAAQCGYCTPGMLLAARALLDRAAAIGAACTGAGCAASSHPPGRRAGAEPSGAGQTAAEEAGQAPARATPSDVDAVAAVDTGPSSTPAGDAAAPVVIDEAAVRHALSGNLCRCTGYQKIVEAVLAVASAAA